MGNYTQFSPRTISTDRAKLWDPSKTLGIINPDKDCLTCVGHAPSQGRRCRNPIRADNRILIMSILDEIAYLPLDSPDIMSRLRSIAGPALCVRYHQDQAETVVMQWERKIQLLKPQTRERKSTKPVQSSRLQEPARDRMVEDLQSQLKEMMEAMAKMREEIDSQWHHSQEREGLEERDIKDRQEERRQRRSEERNREARKKESERLEKERLEKERLEKERLKKERLKKERLEKERLEKERLEKERLEKERLEKERLAREKREEEEEKQRRERIRRRAQKLREERERERQANEQKERDEWDQLWKDYQEQWTQFRAPSSDIREGNIRDAIPWPVKSGSYCDAKYSNVRAFFENAAPRDENMAKLMRKECLKWHPDRRCIWLRDAQLSDVDRMIVDMILRVATDLLNGSAAGASEL